jgi:hypothetical protein
MGNSTVMRLDTHDHRLDERNGAIRLPPGPLFRAADAAYIIVRPFGPLPRSRWASEGGHNVSRAGRVRQKLSGRAQPRGEVGLYDRGRGLQAAIALHQK